MALPTTLSIARTVGRLKWSVERYFMHNFFLYYYTKKLFHVLPFMLPHERDYWGLKLLLKDGEGLFLDVGANDGISALSFRHINRTYSILSLEPNPLHRLSLERVKKRIRLFNFRLCAAGDEPGSLVLSVPTYKGIPNHSGAFCEPEQQRVFEAEFPPKMVAKFKYVTQTVPVIRIDDLHLSPTVVKVDAEGYDLRVIRGMEETIRRCHPILMVENNPALVGATSKLLGDWGYQVLEYDHNRNLLIPYSGRRTRNVFFTLRANSPNLEATDAR
jgi:FkbM family methyltransferase